MDGGCGGGAHYLCVPRAQESTAACVCVGGGQQLAGWCAVPTVQAACGLGGVVYAVVNSLLWCRPHDSCHQNISFFFLA